MDCGEDCKNFKLSAVEIKEILGCELSQMEFADALAMQASSPFVEQMFQLADKDRNGYISFREFLDILFIFAKGKIFLQMMIQSMMLKWKTMKTTKMMMISSL